MGEAELMVVRETDDALLATIGIPAASSVGIDDYCARRGWRVRRSSLANGQAVVQAHCVTITGVRHADGPRAQDDAELGRACVEPAGRSLGAHQVAMTQAARQALGHALASQGV